METSPKRFTVGSLAVGFAFPFFCGNGAHIHLGWHETNIPGCAIRTRHLLHLWFLL